MRFHLYYLLAHVVSPAMDISKGELEFRDSDSDSLSVVVADADVDTFDACFGCGCFSVTVKLVTWG